jgi:N-acetylglucosaminyldiphosphoundecaprenol N-acetyl-beta-D-mannosaminyltransferase
MIGAMAGTDHPQNTCTVMGTELYAGDLEGAVAAVIERALARRGGYASLTGVHGLTLAQRDPGLRHALREAWMNFPDGAPVAWLLRRVTSGDARRVGGPDLFARVADRGRKEGLRHFLVGSTEPVLERLERELGVRFPGVQIVGRFAPPFAERPAVDEAAGLIAATQPHIVWVGLGAPKQELWSSRAAMEVPGVTFIGVGAAFDFVAGVKRRAPAWMHRAGLEWLYRMATEPRRLTSRYVRSNSEFVWRTGRELGARRRVLGLHAGARRGQSRHRHTVRSPAPDPLQILREARCHTRRPRQPRLMR